MELEFFGADQEVTGSCHSLSTANEKIMVDCGMFQGDEDLEKLNYEDFLFKPKEYSAVLLTHAYLDHCGRIPHLINAGFNGKIFATEATKELAFIVMADSAHIAQEDAKNDNRDRADKGLPARDPIYTMNDVNKAMNLFEIVEYDKPVKITDNMTATYYDAGHILGSSSIQLKVTEGDETKTFAFSGDLGQESSILMPHVEAITEADYVLMESTYGNRLHESIEKRKEETIRIIKETHGRGGKLMIPVFAIERTQEMLYYIGKFMDEGLIPKMPVYLDSPMAIRSTEVFKKFTKLFNEDVQKRMEKTGDVFTFPGLKLTMSRHESIEINALQEPCIIMAGSGMCTAGRIKHHLANNAEDERNTILFVGFQVKGTLGNLIQGGQKKINVARREIEIKSKIETIEGFSAHADKDDLHAWIGNFKNKPEFFVIHGEPEQQEPLCESLTKKGYKCNIPALISSAKL